MIKIYGALRLGDGTVGISYDRLWKLMIERKLNKTELTNRKISLRSFLTTIKRNNTLMKG